MSPQPALADDATALTVRAWEALKQKNAQLRIATVEEFTQAVEMKPTSLNDRLAILTQAGVIFQHFYPHLYFKQRIYNTAKPVEALATLSSKAAGMKEIEFHTAVLHLFDCVRDAHTLYAMPTPFRHAIAILPFQMRIWVDGEGKARYSVTKTLDSGDGTGFGHRHFGTGAEITGWDGVPICDFIESFSADQPGGNKAALLSRFAVGATIRPLTWMRLEALTGGLTAIEYIAEGESIKRSIGLPWGVMTGLTNPGRLPDKAFSFSQTMSVSHRAGKAMFGRTPASGTATVDPQDISGIPEAFSFTYSGGPRHDDGLDPALLRNPAHSGARLGYIHIKRFSEDEPGQPLGQTLVDEFKRILLRMTAVAPEALLIDIRGNPGGDIQAAERMLQMLTANRISPATFHFANTPAIQSVLGKLKEQPARPGDSVQLVNARRTFADWLDDPLAPPDTNPLTSGRVLTPVAAANDTGQVYKGKVALMIDALTYSAADIFAAGFQDHQIGQIIGAAPNTGGGGGQVWHQEDLVSNVPELPGLTLQRLPGDAGMTLAIRRCLRVNAHAGEPIEDDGVKADISHNLTKRDLIDSADLIALACRMVLKQPAAAGS